MATEILVTSTSILQQPHEVRELRAGGEPTTLFADTAEPNAILHGMLANDNAVLQKPLFMASLSVALRIA